MRFPRLTVKRSGPIPSPMDGYKKFGSSFPGNDKIRELKDVLKGQKAASEASTEASNDEISQTPTEEFLEDSVGGTNAEADQKIQSLTDELEKARAEAKRSKDELIRTIAEFDNTRKRLKRESEELGRYANEKLLKEFLPILDNLEMSLAHASGAPEGDALIEGIRLTLKQFLATLEKFGLTPIEGQGQAFDPNTQEAIGTQETNEIPEGHVAQVHRKGYRLHERVVRPAMVSVAKPLLQ